MKNKLFIPALWWREYRQTKTMLALMLFAMGIIFLTVLLRAWDQSLFQATIHNNQFDDSDFVIIVCSFILFIGGILLPIWQLGPDRRNKGAEQLFSLPYRREVIYITKWLMGVCWISIAVILSILNSIILKFLVFDGNGTDKMSLTFIKPWLSCLFVIVVMYTFVLCLGTFTGTWVAQVAFVMIGYLLYQFIKQSIEQLYRAWDEECMLFEWIPRPIEHLLDFRWIEDGFEQKLGGYSFAGLSSIACLLLLVGIVFYARNLLENNGKLVIFPGIMKFLIFGCVLCSVLLGGSMGSHAMINIPRTGYIIGAIIGFILGYFIIRMLNHMRIKM